MAEDLDEVALFWVVEIKEVLGITAFFHGTAEVEGEASFILSAGAVAFVAILGENGADSVLEELNPFGARFIRPRQAGEQ